MKPRALLLCLPALLAAAICRADDLNLTGATVPPYPERWSSAAGMCLSDSPRDKDRDCAYALEIQMTPRGRTLLFESALASTKDAEVRWLVLDQVNYAERPADRTFILGSCERFGRLDPGIVALVKLEHVEWYRVLRAYRANFKTGRLDEIPLRGVRCFDPGWDA